MGRIWTPCGGLVNGGMVNGGHALVNAGAIRAHVSSPSNGLLNGLTAYWTLDADTWLDSTANANTLTGSGGPSTGTGIISSGVALARASVQYLYRADTSSLSVGNEDFSIAAWVNFANLAATTTYGIVGKDDNGTTFEYVLYYNTNGNFFVFGVRNHTAGQSVSHAKGYTPSTGTWYLVVAVHNSVTDTVGISINADALSSEAYGYGSEDRAGDFYLGSRGAVYGNYKFDGIIDEVGFWKRALSAADITALYNAGAGLTYTDFSA